MSSEDRLIAVECGLRASGLAVRRMSQVGWCLTAGRQGLAPLRAAVSGGEWLQVIAPLAPPVGSTWSMLGRNAQLGGSARLVLAPGGEVEARAEMYLGDGFDAAGREADDDHVADRVRMLVDDVISASGSLPCETRPRGGSGEAEPLLQWCTEAGWAAAARAPGEVQVRFDLGARVVQASLFLDSSAHLVGFMPLTARPVPSGPGGDAIAQVLVELGAHVRAVKGAVHGDADEAVAGVGVAGERWPATPESVDRALTALWVAAGLAGREVQALQDATIAREFLALRGTAEGRAPTQLVHHHQPEDAPCLHLP